MKQCMNVFEKQYKIGTILINVPGKNKKSEHFV
jgi:hypothetical protein